MADSATNNINFHGKVNNTGGIISANANTGSYNDAQPQTKPPPQVETTNVLFVLSNPRGTNGLRLDTEMRAIQESLRLSSQREHIQSRTLPAATANDLRRAMLEETYQIVHLAGHGKHDGFMLEDDRGQIHLVSQEALAAHFSMHRKDKQALRCVILNACFTFAIGQRIALGVPYAIAMSGPVSDPASIEFSRGFYDAIGAGMEIERAYNEGMSAVRFAGLDHNFLAQLL
jgi:CHAT domain-containing protein